MANKIRGEGEILLNGKKYTLFFNNGSAEEIEQKYNLAWYEILGHLEAKSFRLSDMVFFLKLGFQKYHSNLTEDEVKEMIDLKDFGSIKDVIYTSLISCFGFELKNEESDLEVKSGAGKELKSSLSGRSA